MAGAAPATLTRVTGTSVFLSSGNDYPDHCSVRMYRHRDERSILDPRVVEASIGPARML